jgi:hypothetical protein
VIPWGAAHTTMGDKWLRDFKAASSLASEIKTEIRSSGGNQDPTARARENAELEQYLRQLDDSVSKLDGELEGADCSEMEYQKRKGQVMSLAKSAGDLKKLRQQKGRNADKGSLMGGGSPGGGTKISRGPAKENSNTIGLSDGDMVQMQEQVLRQQDQDLSKIHDAVRRVGQIASNINDESRLQDKVKLPHHQAHQAHALAVAVACRPADLAHYPSRAMHPCCESSVEHLNLGCSAVT